MLSQGKEADTQTPVQGAWRRTSKVNVNDTTMSSDPRLLTRQSVLQESSAGPEGSDGKGWIRWGN